MNWMAVLDVAMPEPKFVHGTESIIGWVVGLVVAAFAIAIVSIICIRRGIKKVKEAEAADKAQTESGKTEEEQIKGE